MLVVHPSLPVKSVKELIDYAKERPGKLNFASPGSGSANRLDDYVSHIDVMPTETRGPGSTEPLRSARLSADATLVDPRTGAVRTIVGKASRGEKYRGRIFYFRPGHETYPTYHHADVQRVIVNAARWAAPGLSVSSTFASA